MFKNKYILIRNLAILFMVGNMLYWLFPFPPVVWRVGFVLLSMYVVLFMEGNKLPCEKAVLAFVVLNLLYFFFAFFSIAPSTTQIGNILCALLSMSLFAFLATKGVMTDKFFSVVSVALSIIAVLVYYHSRASTLERLYLDDDAGMTNNTTGFFAYLLVMLFLLKNNIQKWAMMFVCVFFLLMGAKRGNILAAAIPVICFVFCELKDSKRSFFKIVVVLLVIAIGSIITYNWIVSNDYLLYRFEQTAEGDSSNRDVIYSNAWQLWSGSNSLLNILFGYGYNGTIYQLQVHAHNDWLEILVDYGLLGIILYLAVFISLFKLIAREKNIQNKMILLSAIGIWFLKTLFSMGFTSESLSLLMISLGTAIGRNKSNCCVNLLKKT